MKQLLIFLVIFNFTSGAAARAEEISQYHKEQNNDEAAVKSLRFQPERDPFYVSTELLCKTMSEHYVTFTGEFANRFNLPGIEITGVMVVNEKSMAAARIESLGEVTLKPDDKIIITSSNSGRKRFNSFIVKEITPHELVILVEEKYEIRGRFR